MKCLLVSATPFEISNTEIYLKENFKQVNENLFQSGKLQVETLVTGVGMPLTALKLGQKFAVNKYDLAINAGIAGAFNKDLKIGDVVNVVSECFGDLGVEEADGNFTDLFEMKLLPENSEIFTNSTLLNSSASEFSFLKQSKGLTINKVHGFPNSISAITKKYKADVESMEGAAFALACHDMQVKYLQIRSISNYVEKRDRDKWNLPLAINNLNDVLIKIFSSLT